MKLSKEEAWKILSALEEADSDLDQFGCDPKYHTRNILRQARKLITTKLSEEEP